MSRVAASLTGTKELQAALREFGINADREIAAIVMGTAQNVRSHAVKSIARGTKSGTVYSKTNPKREHRASAPGEAPVTDTGRLVGSIKANISGKTAEVVVDTVYAAALEFGTRTIQPRPFLVPALEKERPKWNARLESLVEKAAKGILK